MELCACAHTDQDVQDEEHGRPSRLGEIRFHEWHIVLECRTQQKQIVHTRPQRRKPCTATVVAEEQVAEKTEEDDLEAEDEEDTVDACYGQDAARKHLADVAQSAAKTQDNRKT